MIGTERVVEGLGKGDLALNSADEGAMTGFDGHDGGGGRKSVFVLNGRSGSQVRRNADAY